MLWEVFEKVHHGQQRLRFSHPQDYHPGLRDGLVKDGEICAQSIVRGSEERSRKDDVQVWCAGETVCWSSMVKSPKKGWSRWLACEY